MKTELAFEHEKETPGTIRFKEVVKDGEQPVVGTLYVKKGSQIASSKKLKVTLESAE